MRSEGKKRKKKVRRKKNKETERKMRMVGRREKYLPTQLANLNTSSHKTQDKHIYSYD